MSFEAKVLLLLSHLNSTIVIVQALDLRFVFVVCVFVFLCLSALVSYARGTLGSGSGLVYERILV